MDLSVLYGGELVAPVRGMVHVNVTEAQADKTTYVVL